MEKLRSEGILRVFKAYRGAGKERRRKLFECARSQLVEKQEVINLVCILEYVSLGSNLAISLTCLGQRVVMCETRSKSIDYPRDDLMLPALKTTQREAVRRIHYLSHVKVALANTLPAQLVDVVRQRTALLVSYLRTPRAG